MRFNRYIISETKLVTTEELFADISKKCKPYLSLLKNKEPLYRGLHDPSEARVTDAGVGIGYGIKKVRKNRIPKGSNKTDFKLLNKWLDGNGHARRDQSISVTANKLTADFFGSNSWVFPIGKFDYSWVKSPDMNHKNEKVGYYVGHFYPEEPSVWDFLRAYYGSGVDSETEKADLAKFVTTNKGFMEAYKKGYEIWIDCKEYYYILTKSQKAGNLDWTDLFTYLK